MSDAMSSSDAEAVHHSDRCARLRRRYLSIGLGEFFAVGVFAFMAITVVGPSLEEFNPSADVTSALWFALAPLLFILIQAGIYWLIARHCLPGGLPRGAARIYRSLRMINPVVLAVGAIGTSLGLDAFTPSMIIVAFVWLFGVLEYVNYYVVRLSYPVRTWFSEVGRWSTPRLVRDIRAATR